MLRILPHIYEGEISINQVASDTQLSRGTVLEILESLGVGALHEETVSFTDSDRLRAALIIIKQGLPVNEVSKRITWRDFEGLSAEILEHFGYYTKRNLQFRRPKIEIDVLGVKEGRSLVIDCKHWRRNLGAAAASKVALLQTERVKVLMASHYVNDMTLKYALPVITTLYAEEVSVVLGVPIVPVEKLSGFLIDLDGHLSNLTLVKPLLNSIGT